MVPVARRVFGEGHDVTFRMRWAYAGALYMDEARFERTAGLDDIAADMSRLAQRLAALEPAALAA